MEDLGDSARYKWSWDGQNNEASEGTDHSPSGHVR